MQMPAGKERADFWLSRVNVAQAAREVIRKLYDVVGGAAIYSRQNPFDLALRDAETWCPKWNPRMGWCDGAQVGRPSRFSAPVSVRL